MTKTWNYLRGYVIIKLEGSNLEKLINLAIIQKVDLWDIKRAGNLIIAKTQVNSLAKLKPLVRKTRCSVKVLRKVGLPFICFRLGRRKGLVTAGVFFLAILYFLTSFVWFIEIKGNKRVDTHAIIQIAAENGLKSPVWRKDVNTKKVETALMSKFPQLAWAGININGTKAVIEVEEKTSIHVEKNIVECLVAKADGLITQLLVISGQPLVKEGDTVKKGQMLITGLLGQEENQGNIPAKGKIKARVWYDFYREGYSKQEVYSRTGRKAKALWLKIGDRYYHFRGVDSSPYPKYEQEESGFQIPKEYNIPFGWLCVTYHEVKIETKQFSFEEMKERLRNRAIRYLKTKIQPGAKITSEKINFLEQSEDIPGLVRLMVRVETLEDIGEIKHLVVNRPRKGSQKE